MGAQVSSFFTLLSNMYCSSTACGISHPGRMFDKLPAEFYNKLVALPLGFEEAEGISLASSCVHLVYCSMQDEEGWHQFASQHQLENVNLFDLKSQFI